MSIHKLVVPVTCQRDYLKVLKEYHSLTNIPLISDSIKRSVSITLYSNKFHQGSKRVDMKGFNIKAFAMELKKLKLGPSNPPGKVRQYYPVTIKYSRDDPRIEVVFDDRLRDYSKNGSE